MNGIAILEIQLTTSPFFQRETAMFLMPSDCYVCISEERIHSEFYDGPRDQ